MRLVDESGRAWTPDDELPDYVRESLCAWARLRCGRPKSTNHVPEAEYLSTDPSYDPESDWLDEPFPEEYE